jgi:hypothetical protein
MSIMVCCHSSILYGNVHAAGEVASIFGSRHIAGDRQLALKCRVSAARREPGWRVWGITTAWLCGGGTIFTIHSHYREYLLRMCAGARPPEPQLAGLSLSALFSLGT